MKSVSQTSNLGVRGSNPFRRATPHFFSFDFNRWDTEKDFVGSSGTKFMFSFRFWITVVHTTRRVNLRAALCGQQFYQRGTSRPLPYANGSLTLTEHAADLVRLACCPSWFVCR